MIAGLTLVYVQDYLSPGCADHELLPDDLWMYIFKKLDFRGLEDILQYCMPVCTRWRGLGFELTSSSLAYSQSTKYNERKVRMIQSKQQLLPVCRLFVKARGVGQEFGKAWSIIISQVTFMQKYLLSNEHSLCQQNVICLLCSIQILLPDS